MPLCSLPLPQNVWRSAKSGVATAATPYLYIQRVITSFQIKPLLRLLHWDFRFELFFHRDPGVSFLSQFD
ncbi:hypothetical protein RB195_019808 [Necator americanus]|uniref:Uncharacterized protein n=1 Tax=Necator americanus TaxID=51031 RepID=A0ABR1CI45_NECAM